MGTLNSMLSHQFSEKKEKVQLLCNSRFFNIQFRYEEEIIEKLKSGQLALAPLPKKNPYPPLLLVQ